METQPQDSPGPGQKKVLAPGINLDAPVEGLIFQTTHSDLQKKKKM